MNTRPDAIKVLCYGDSNTWGQRPDKKNRYAPNVRWTGKLQELLGDGYYVVEEGLSSRTTDLEYEKPGRNGKTYLVPCLISHNPIDVVVMMLGTNDVKTQFHRDTATIAASIKGLIGDVNEFAKDASGNTPKIILVSPILIDDTAVHFAEIYHDVYNHDSAVKSQGFAEEYKKVANETGCVFIDAASVAKAGDDGIHFDEASHPELAKRVATTIARV